jgi:8-oxo-dGTP diphosphatase
MTETRDATGPEETVRVVAAVLEREGAWLVGRRPEEKRHGSLWEFPGGKVLPGETTLQAARRELAEELTLTALAVGETLLSVRDRGSPFVVDFVEVTAAGSPRALEHGEIGWFDLESLDALALAPADRAFVDWLRAHRGD